MFKCALGRIAELHFELILGIVKGTLPLSHEPFQGLEVHTRMINTLHGLELVGLSSRRLSRREGIAVSHRSDSILYGLCGDVIQTELDTRKKLGRYQYHIRADGTAIQLPGSIPRNLSTLFCCLPILCMNYQQVNVRFRLVIPPCSGTEKKDSFDTCSLLDGQRHLQSSVITVCTHFSQPICRWTPSQLHTALHMPT